MRTFFSNPWMLLAVVAVTLPLIIEWLFRRRKRQVDLPTIIYLLRNKEQEKIKRQDRILLLLRMLGILLLVLAIARPLIKRGLFGGGRRRNIVVLLDGTGSMNQQMGVTTAFGLSQKKSAALIRELPEDAIVTVVNLGERVESVAEAEEDRHTAAAKVESLRCGMGAAPFAEGLQWIKDYLERSRTERAELYLFSDFQKYTWMRQGSLTAETSELFNSLAARHETFLVDVGGEPSFNYMVTAMRPSEWVMTTGMPVKFKVLVETWGRPPKDARATVTFLVDDVKKDVREIHPGTDGPTSVTFDHSFATPGEFVVEAVLDGDKHLVDNRRSYLCTVPERFGVLVLDESADVRLAAESSGNAAQAAEAAKDLGRESAFLARAIEPPSHPGLEKVSRFGVNVIHPSMLRYVNLNEYPVTVVTQISAVDSNMVPRLENYVADGGALWFFLGPNVSQYEYNKHFYREGGGLLPCALEMTKAEKASGSGGERAVFLSFGESTHQAMSALGDTMDKDARWLRYWTLRDAEQARVVLRLSNGDPAVVEKRFGRGKVLLANSTAGVDWTYLPATMEFPVMVQDVLRYLVGDPDAGVNLNAGDTYKQLAFVSTQHLLLRLPDGEKVRLAPRKKDEKDTAWFVGFDGTSQQGVYEFVDVAPGVLSRPRFVVNQKPDEGDLGRLSSGDFQNAFGRGDWQWCGPDKPVEVIAAKLHSITEFAPGILWLLGGILCVESFLAARFGRRRAIRSRAPVSGGEGV